MTTIIIKLPEELAKEAEAKGLLSSEAFESYLKEKLQKEGAIQMLDGNMSFNPEREGLVNPAVYRKGKILGDIIGPFPEEWGETP